MTSRISSTSPLERTFTGRPGWSSRIRAIPSSTSIWTEEPGPSFGATVAIASSR